MDLGATVCVRSRPQCLKCPLREVCVAHRDNLTAVLPTPKPPAARRTEHYEVSLRMVGNRLWVEQRPPRGIWGGLWMAPMRLLPDGQVPERAPDLVHELTHRRYCLYVRVERQHSPRFGNGADGGADKSTEKRADTTAGDGAVDCAGDCADARYTSALSQGDSAVAPSAGEMSGQWLPLPLDARAPVPAALKRLLAAGQLV